MTNTKFRKRALISSVAMLLVALIALGSATFAWFAVDTTVNTAQSINMTTSASTGIKILSDTERALWEAVETGKSDEMYDKDGILLDAAMNEGVTAANLTSRSQLHTKSLAEGEHKITQPIIPFTSDTSLLSPNSKWATNTGTSASNGTAKDAAYGTAALSASNSYSEKIFFMQTSSDGTEKIKKAKVNWSGSADISPATRVAMLDSNGKLLAVWGATSADIKGYDETNTKAAALTGKAVAKNAEFTFSGDGLTVSTSANTTYVTIVVYIDGEDSAATSNYANAGYGSSVLSGLQVYFSIA